MKKRLTALILALTLVFALGAGAVSADDETAAPTAETTEAAEPAAETTDAETAEESEEEPEAPAEPDAEGTLSFANLESRIRENSYTLLTLELQMEEIDAKSIEQMRAEVIEAMNGIADMQWGMINGASMANEAYPGLYSPDEVKLYSATGRVSAQSYQSTYDSLKQRLKDIDDGKTAQDMESMRRQVAAGEDQLVMAMESAYIQLKGFEAQDAAITRGLAAYDRAAKTARVSYENGLVSQLAVEQLAAQREQLSSTQKTLRMGVEAMLLNLKAMVGAELDAPLALTALPKVTAAQLAAMDLEADLARAAEASADLYDAKLTYERAREDYAPYGGASAQRSWKSAQYTYEGAVQSFELKFRSLYAQVKDYAQKLDAAKSALALEEKNYAVSALKRGQGTISQNALADAADALADAKDTVTGAERDLLSAYRNYRWAVERGILN